MTEPRCETCRFWMRREEQRIGGPRVHVGYSCCRYPVFVEKAHSDWCGEWREREPQPWDVTQR